MQNYEFKNQFLENLPDKVKQESGINILLEDLTWS